MDPYEPVAVVPRSALARGQRLRKLWLAGWIFGLVAVVGGAFSAGQAVAYRRSMRELAEARQEIQRVTELQSKETASFVKAWEDQRHGIDLVVTWATWLKDREDLVAFNKKNPAEPYASLRK